MTTYPSYRSATYRVISKSLAVNVQSMDAFPALPQTQWVGERFRRIVRRKPRKDKSVMANFWVSKRIRRNLRVLMLASTALTLGISGLCSAAESDNERSELSAPIEGSWIFTVTRINNLPASFTAVSSFTAGGVFLATGSNDHLSSPGPVSPLYGSWKRTEQNLYISTTQFFAFNPVTGEAVAMLKAVQTFKLTSHDELVGVGEAWACDVQGQNCQRTPVDDITIKGARIIPQNVTGLILPPD